MAVELSIRVQAILEHYTPTNPTPTAASLRELWLEFTPKSTGFAKAECWKNRRPPESQSPISG